MSGKKGHCRLPSGGMLSQLSYFHVFIHFLDGCPFYLVQVISRKDQAQYWFHKEQSYSYVSVDQFIKRFNECHIGQNLDEELSKPFHKSQSHKNALCFKSYSLSKWELFKACSMRELLLMKRNSFTYVFKSVQVIYLLYCFVLSSFMISLHGYLYS